MADHTAVSVLLLSVFIFLFFKYCLGSTLENAAGVEHHGLVAEGSKCPVGTVFSTHRQECKDIVMSPKSLSDRMLLLLPYFLKGAEGPR